jgi:hypothetical protein
VSWRLVNDRVEEQMAIVERMMVPLEPVLWPDVMMPEDRMLDERILDTPFVLPPACALMRRIMVTMADNRLAKTQGTS